MTTKDESAPAVNGDSLKDTAVSGIHSMATRIAKLTPSGAANEGGSTTSHAPPPYSTANDTPLTPYHSFFYGLFGWKHKRTTGITFLATVVFILASRYLPIIRWLLKLSYLTLGVVTLAEVSGKFIAGGSIAGTIRPRKYYRIPKEALDSFLDNIEELVNFFVIEIQRIVFAENVPVTATAFTAAFLSYYLIRLLPAWIFALIFTNVVFLGPLIYIENQEFIDSHLEHAGEVVHTQAAQVKDLTVQQTSKGLEVVKTYTSDYATKAHEIIGNVRQKIPLPAAAKSPASPIKEGDFPSAPKTALPSYSAESKPAVQAPAGSEPIATS